MPITNSHYGKLYEQCHNNGMFPGQQVKFYYEDIKRHIEFTGSKTLLDYGCGKGLCYLEKKIHNKWGGIMPTLYDPYYKPHSKIPVGKFDGVICTDVLEHVPEPDIRDVLDSIFSYANRFVFINISTKHSKKNLPNGENCHITVHPKEWWIARVEEVKNNYSNIIATVVFSE
jgi:hypothetical protein